MAWTYTFDTSTPLSTDSPRDGDDKIRELKLAIHERMDVDHFLDLTGTSQTDTDGGKHRQVTLMESAAAPTTAANEGGVYTKEATGQSELFFREESDGDEVQITAGGHLKPTVDDSTIELSSGTVQLKDAGITAAKLGATLIGGDDIEVNGSNQLAINVPDAGADADSVAAPVILYGTYTGTGSEITVTVGATVRAVFIARSDAVLFGGGFAIKPDDSIGQMGIAGEAIGSGGITISTTTFIIAASNSYTNASGKTYAWLAICER